MDKREVILESIALNKNTTQKEYPAGCNICGLYKFTKIISKNICYKSCPNRK